jgi:hypothetical protein
MHPYCRFAVDLSLQCHVQAGRLVAAEEAKIERLAAHGYPLLCIPV